MNTVVKNIINKYGKEGLGALIECFKREVTYDIIAKQYGVSKQRVFQWKKELGKTKKVFLVYEDVLSMLKLKNIDNTLNRK